ncbi:MAG: hypothetical protein HQL08_06595 [Nitrospirae bacterium]|nr:hypothetical protein [Nitrospirota bacterium]
MGFGKTSIFIFVISAMIFSLTDAARCEENKWKFVGKTEDNNALVYYAPASVNYVTDTFVRLMLKRELSPEGTERFRENFNAAVREAEAKAGEKIGGPSEPVLNALIKRETKEYLAEIDCVSNKLMVPPEKTKAGEVNFVTEITIKKGTTAETIRNEVCTKK